MTFNRSINCRCEQVGVMLCYSLDPIRYQAPVSSTMALVFVMLHVVNMRIICSRFIGAKIVDFKAMHIAFQIAHASHYPGAPPAPWRKCFHVEGNRNAFVK